MSHLIDTFVLTDAIVAEHLHTDVMCAVTNTKSCDLIVHIHASKNERNRAFSVTQMWSDDDAEIEYENSGSLKAVSRFVESLNRWFATHRNTKNP
jgi:hypothetical protein